MKSVVPALVVAVALSFAPFAAARQAPHTGVLLLAHGGSDEWNGRVTAIRTEADRVLPTEVAFGMATRANIAAALDRLVARGVTSIVAVPLFVSSHSSVITSTEYLLGLRAEMPPDLKAFAAMSHGQHDEHAGMAGADGTSPIVSRVPIRMTKALDAHPVVADILLSRIGELSRTGRRGGSSGGARSNRR